VSSSLGLTRRWPSWWRRSRGWTPPATSTGLGRMGGARGPSSPKVRRRWHDWPKASGPTDIWQTGVNFSLASVWLERDILTTLWEREREREIVREIYRRRKWRVGERAREWKRLREKQILDRWYCWKKERKKERIRERMKEANKQRKMEMAQYS